MTGTNEDRVSEKQRVLVRENPDVLEGLDLNLDRTLQEVLTSVITDQLWFKYDPLDLDSLLREASSGFDRCLAYRREHQDLIAMAFAQVDAYNLFQRQFEVARTLEEAGWVETLRSREAQLQRGVSDVFQAAAAEPLAAGFRAVAEGSSMINAEGAAAEANRRRLVHERWAIIAAHQESIRERHCQRGHPLNYKDRADRVRDFLLDDFSEATAKAIAASIGLRWGYNLRRNFSEQLCRPLDDLVDWTRAAIRMLDEATSGLSETEYIYPLSIALLRHGADDENTWSSFIRGVGAGLFSSAVAAWA